jgi:hypothetical protein
MARDVELSFSDKEITPWGGMALMSRMLQKIGFREALGGVQLPTQGSNRGYAPAQLIEQFLVSVWCGANRFEHLEVTRYDEAIRKIFDYKRMAGHKAFQRYFRKFRQADNQRVFQGLYQWFFKQLHFDNFTLDLDSTVISRYGQQEGARRGYNPRKPGRNSHHPLLAFVADCRMVANCWLRSGDAHTANNFEGFLQDTLTNLEGKTIGLLRADSGFCQTSILEHLEKQQRPIPYIIAARLHAPVQRMLAEHRQWCQVEEGIEVGSVSFKANGWDKERRMVMVRQQIARRPKATGKALKLFAEDVGIKDYRYSCFVTSLELPAHLVWKIYRMRADAENRIKELKYDFGADSFNMQSFSATEASMNCVMIAYNLMSLFRQVVVCSKVQPTLKTMRYKIFATGGYLIKEGNRRILKLCLAMRRRQWFEGLWGKSRSFDLPTHFPSHL